MGFRITPIGWLCACLMLAASLCLPAPVHAEDVDRTLAVVRGTRLQVRLYGGEVVVRGWGRDEVRVRATVFQTDAIEIQNDAGLVRIGARSSHGVPHAIDLQIDVPAWMPVDIRGTYLTITMAGVGGEVTAETVRGDVRVRGGAGTVALSSVEGEIVLEGARGRATLSAVNNGIRVSDLVGDLVAETVSGAVRLQRIQGAAMSVGTGSGDISWDGLMSSQGRYQFATHSGDVDIDVPDRASAIVNVRPFEGRFRATFPLTLPDAAARGQRFTFALGTGAARLDLETFMGTISLRRAEPVLR